MVEEAVVKKKLSYIDAIVDVCDKHMIELDDVAKFIGPTLKEKLHAEAMKLNFLPKQNTLPF